MGQRWPWLDPDAPEATPSLHRTLHVKDRRFDDFGEEGWMRFAHRPDPGPFGIFDRLALADAASDMHEPDPDPEPMWKLAVGFGGAGAPTAPGPGRSGESPSGAPRAP